MNLFHSKKFRFLTILSAFLFFTIVLILSPVTRRRIYIIFSPSCIYYKQSVFSNKLSDRIIDYSLMAKALGIDPCKDEDEIKKRVKDKQLVQITSSRYYTTESMTYSYPYLTGDAKSLLDEIGRRFREETDKAGLPGSKFIITSMIRTTDKMKGLRRSNTNASLNSPHLNGNAFDISYIRFSSMKLFITPCDKRFFKETLAEIIVRLREENRCWATYEKNQNCFHVVSR